MDSAGNPGNAASTASEMSSDGRYAAFESLASNLVPGDTNDVRDAFVHDTETGITERVSVASDETQANAEINSTVMSADGRFVAFQSMASNLAPGLAGTYGRVFVRDRVAGTTELVSTALDGSSAFHSFNPAISGDGRFVSFLSYDCSITAPPCSGWAQIYVRDRQSGAIEKVSVASDGTPANKHASYTGVFSAPVISGDGRYVAYHSMATNLAPGDPHDHSDIFVRDRLAGTTELVSTAWNGGFGDWSSLYPKLSTDGRYVAFSSSASNIAPVDTNNTSDVFVRDRTAGTTQRVSIAYNGNQSNGYSYNATMSGDGRFVSFFSEASNLIPGGTPGWGEGFLRDRSAATTTRTNISTIKAISFDGRYWLHGTTDVFRVDRTVIPPTPAPTQPPAGPGIDNLSIDVEEDATPANTPASVGSIETCRRINNNDLLDADEDSLDSITMDLVTGPIGVPIERPAIAFSSTLNYDSGKLTISGSNGYQFLAGNTGSSIIDASDPVPDADGVFNVAVVDAGSGPGESGDGVLSRITIEATNVSPWLATLHLTNNTILDAAAYAIPIAAASGAKIALDAACTDSDVDGDGAPDFADNCRDVYNYDQFNHDDDAMGDMCDVDDDNAGVYDVDEVACGGNPIVAANRPERTDGVFAGQDDDADGSVDEPLAPGTAAFDCDGDGYSGTAEDKVFGAAARGNQDPCGTSAWPADFVAGGVPTSTNQVTITDLTSFLAPVRYFGTNLGANPGDQRWDLDPGPGLFATDINITDLTSLITVAPPMLGGTRAFNGPPCPSPP